MKDYFDLLNLLRESRMSSGVLVAAVSAMFTRRRTAIPAKLPVGLSKAFATDASKQRQWHAFLARNRLHAPTLEAVVEEIASAVAPILSAIAAR